MKNQPRESKYKLKRSVWMVIALFILVVIGAGCATPTPPPQEQGSILRFKLAKIPSACLCLIIKPRPLIRLPYSR